MTAAQTPSAQTVTVRFWASARAAAGTAEAVVPVRGAVTLAELREELVRRHGERLARVLPVCSVLVGDRPCGTADPRTVEVLPGAVVEFLPPFAGG